MRTNDEVHGSPSHQEIVEQKPDVVVVETTVGVAALARESRAIPMIFVNVSDPVGSGFVANLAHPGGNITGFMSNEPTLGGKWPELLKEIAPDSTVPSHISPHSAFRRAVAARNQA
jgi:putative ABC transport system substrate-binding protein